MHEERKVRIYNIMIIRNPEPDDNKGQKGTRAGKVVSESTMRVSIHRIGASPYIHWLDSRPAARTRIWYAAAFDLEYNPGNTRPALRCSVRSAIQSVHHLPTLCSQSRASRTAASSIDRIPYSCVRFPLNPDMKTLNLWNLNGEAMRWT